MTAILANGAPPVHEVPLRVLRGAQRLIACDGAWRAAMELGRRPDAVVGDGDSLGDGAGEELSRIGVPFVADDGQDTNDLCKALSNAVATGGAEGVIAILGATGRREDHSIGNVFYLTGFAEECAGKAGWRRQTAGVAIVTDSGVFEPVLPPGGEWEVEPGQPVSVFAPLPGTEMSSEGLEWPLKGVNLEVLWRGTLNRASGRSFSVRTSRPAIIFRPHLQSGGVFWYISHLSDQMHIKKGQDADTRRVS